MSWNLLTRLSKNTYLYDLRNRVTVIEQWILNFIPGTGPKGDTGTQGTQGLKGDKGDTGNVGATGLAGSVGNTGSTGAAGTNGTNGTTGAQGIQGVKGDIGLTGSQGIQGVKGDAGSQGSQGIQGTAGTNGTNGTTPAIRVGSVTVTLIGSKVVTFSTAMPNANYQVFLQPISGISVSLTPITYTITGFTISASINIAGTISYLAIANQ